MQVEVQVEGCKLVGELKILPRNPEESFFNLGGAMRVSARLQSPFKDLTSSVTGGARKYFASFSIVMVDMLCGVRISMCIRCVECEDLPLAGANTMIGESKKKSAVYIDGQVGLERLRTGRMFTVDGVKGQRGR